MKDYGTYSTGTGNHYRLWSGARSEFLASDYRPKEKIYYVEKQIKCPDGEILYDWHGEFNTKKDAEESML